MSKTDSRIATLDFRKANFSLFRDLLGSIPWEAISRGQKDAGELSDIQEQSPQSRGMVLSTVQESKQAWQKASMGEHGDPV